MTSGMPESTVATSELVVPRSMPTILPTPQSCHRCPPVRTSFSISIFPAPRQVPSVARLDAQNTTDRFEFERALLQRGVKVLAGVDEAGRGPLAGPVVAAAVSLPTEWISNGLPVELAKLNDSKQLSAVQRQKFFAALTANHAVQFAIAWTDAETIDAINILQATQRAMNQALRQLQPAPEHVQDPRPLRIRAGVEH